MTSEAFERIRDAIVSGGLEFGEPLSETQIATALGMSKAPVRAAFIELRDKGLVNHRAAVGHLCVLADRRRRAGR